MKKNFFGKEKKMDRADQNAPDKDAVTSENAAFADQAKTDDSKSALDDFDEPTQAEWREALETAVQQRDEYLSMAQRSQAEFQNFKKRNERARADAYDDGVREAIAAILTTVDNLERAIDAAKQAGEAQALVEGVEMTQRQLLETLAKLGMEEIPALNEKFDPELHNAVMRSEEGEPGTVTEVFQKGYRVKDRVIRYPMVKVAVES